MAARTSQLVVETIVPTITYSPSTPTGAGASQIVLEAILADSSPLARTSQLVVEAIVASTSAPGDPQGGGGGDGEGGGQHSFGYAL